MILECVVIYVGRYLGWPIKMLSFAHSGKVSCRCSPTTHRHSTHCSLQLIHCSGAAPSGSLVSPSSWLLADPATLTLSSLDGGPLQDGGQPELALCGAKLVPETTSYPPPRLLRIKPDLLPSRVLLLPPYLSTSSPSFSPSSRGTPSLLSASQSSTLISVSPFLSLQFNPAHPLCCV